MKTVARTALIALLLIGLGCSTPSDTVITASPSDRATPAAGGSASSTPEWPAAVTPSILGAPNCQPPSQLISITSGGLRPLLGTPKLGATRAILALFLRPTVGVEQKMILRMNGAGPVAMDAQHTDGTRIAITRIDSGHGSSSYDPIFPGTDEFGVLFTFPKAGCWQIDVRRTGAAADFYFLVDD